MPDEQRADAVELPLTAEEVAAQSFPTAFRGFDPVEVRAFLGRIADELQSAAEREDELRRALAAASMPGSEAEAVVLAAGDVPVELAHLQAALAEAQARVADLEDRARLHEADAAEVAVDAARTLADARSNAARVTSDARDEAGRILGDARDEAGRLRAEADKLVGGAKEAAAAAGIELRRDAEREAALIRVRAREDADSIIEAAKERGREMVGEAQAARERMLKDLARRRRAAQGQLEHLKESRDRVLEHLRLARRAVDDVTSRFEPVEAGWGETPTTPGRPAPALPTSPGRLAPAPPASPPTAPPTQAVFAPPVPVEEVAGPQQDAPAAPQGNEVADDVRPVQREERRSSALRILRRSRPPTGDESLPADEMVEGVRIIGSPQRMPAPDAEPAPAEAEPSGAEPAPREPADVAPAETAAETAGVDEVAEELAEEDDTGDEGRVGAVDEELDEPPRQETIEELFARIREAQAPEPLGTNEHDAAGNARGTSAASDAPSEVVSDEDERLLQRRDVAIEEPEATLSRRLKRALQDEQNAVLDALRTVRGEPTVDALLGDPDGQQGRYRRLAAPLLGQAATAGAQQAGGEVAGGEVAGVEVAGLDEVVTAFASEVADGVRERITRMLDDAANEAAEDRGLVERVNAVYREVKGQRAERLGAHFVVAAYARGAFDATPEGTRLRWIVDDAGPCPDCDDNALAGAMAKGEAYPTGQLHPPAHIGCRCILARVDDNN